MKVKNMRSSKGNAIVNQFIIEDGNRLIFQSYDSTIAIVENEKAIKEGNVIYDGDLR